MKSKYIQQPFLSKDPFWKYLLGSLVIIIFNLIGQLPLSFFLMQESTPGSVSDPMELLRGLDKNLQLFLLLIPFIVGFLGLWLVIVKLHERTFNQLTTAREKVDCRRVLFTFSVWSLLTALLVGLDYSLNPESFTLNFDATKFGILFLIAVALIPIQTSLEEFIFRGYLMQGFAGLFKNAWGPLLMTSVIFGLLHLFNPEVEKLGYGILAYYIGTGFFLGIMTLMDEGIELALGFHAANNLITALLVTSSWTAFQTESILIDHSEPSLGVELLLSLVLFYPLFLILLAKRYKWTHWRSKLLARF